MPDRKKVIKDLEECLSASCRGFRPRLYCPYDDDEWDIMRDALLLLKEQEKKQITLHKKHVITCGRNDEFSTRKLYEAICETLLDEGELFVARTPDHEKVDFVFYVTEGW